MEDMNIKKAIKERWDTIAKPVDGLGKMEELVCRLGEIQKTTEPDITKKCALVFCADNGIVKEGISQTGQDVTYSVASWMGENISSVCRFARLAGADVLPVDIGINSKDTPKGVLNKKIVCGTRNFLEEPALTKEECTKAIDVGRELVKECKEKGYKIIATGEMGIGNTTTASALAEILLGDGSGSFVGRGAGLDDQKLIHKKDVVKKAYELYKGKEPFEVLRSIGGADIAGLAGVFIGGFEHDVPVIIDGAISAMAAVCAEKIRPGVKEAMLPSHIGREAAIEAALDFLGIKDLAVIHADLALGEGTGAVMLLPLLDMALNYYDTMMRFDDTAVDQYERFAK